MTLDEDEAYQLFRKLRWPETDGAPVCPRCGGCDAYEITTRRKFKCKACSHQFSVTSGTIFASRKLGFTDMLAAIAILANSRISILQLARNLDVQYNSAWALSHKIQRKAGQSWPTIASSGPARHLTNEALNLLKQRAQQRHVGSSRIYRTQDVWRRLNRQS